MAAEPPLAVAAGYTPPHLAREVLITRTALEGERKLVTVLFCDLANSTSLAEQIGAERMHGLLDHFFELALQEIHRYEGTINQFLGDGFMALFGAPIAHEDHPQRAARAALAIQQAVTIGQRKTDGQGIHLQLRMGLNTGWVVVGKIGDNLRMDYTAVGDTTNLAARLQQAAAPRDIYLSDNTYEAIRQYFDCESLGDRRLKGKSEPVSIYRLRGLHGPQNPAPRDPMAVHSAMVGREREYAMLRSCFGRLREGAGGIVGILGDAGVGKSRLVSEVRLAEHAGLCWLEGRAVSFGQGISYGPFIEIIRNLAGITPRDTHTEVWSRLGAWLDELTAGEGLKHLPYVGALLGCERRSGSSDSARHLDAEDLRGQIYISVRRLVERLAARGPVVLQLDDWHWADDASAGLLEHLLPLTESIPLLILFAGRRDGGTPCARARSQASQHRDQRYVELLLGPLSSSDSNKLIDNLLLLTELPPQLRGMILERADGNPFFIEEVIRSLISTGALRKDAVTGRLQLMVRADEIALPDRIEGVIMARIDRLEEDVKQVLKLAAVIGRTFYQRILQALDQAEHHLDDCLGQLQKLELIRQKQALPELEFMFKHALVQEVSYASILADRRRKLHAQVAGSIERLFADRLDEFAGFLAYHYARAEVWEKAQRYLFLAGDQAVRMAADVEAMTHYQQALAAYERIYGQRWDPLQRASLARKMGEALFRLGKDDEAAEQFRAALSYLGTTYPRTRIAVRLRILREILQQVWHRVVGPGSLARSAASAGTDEEKHRVYVRLGLIDYYGDPQRFLLDVLASLNWAEQRGLTSAIAMGSMGLGVICDVLGLRRLAGHYHRRAATIAKYSEDASAQALSLYGLGFHDLYAGRWGSTREHLIEAVQAWRDVGAIRELGISIGTLVWLAQWRGDIRTSGAMTAQLARLAMEAGDHHIDTWVSVLTARQRAREGGLDEAVSMQKKIIESLKLIPDYPVLVDTYGHLADCYLRRGDLPNAFAALAQADQWTARKSILGHLMVFPPLVRIWANLARAEQSDERGRSAALRAGNRACSSALKLGRVFPGAVPQALCGLGSLKWISGRRDAARKYWRRSLKIAEQLEATYDLALIHREVGRLTDDASALQAACTLFRETGATFDAAQTLRHLGEIALVRDPQQSRGWFEESLQAHATMSAEHERALTHRGYSQLCKALGRDEDARRHFSEAVELFRRCGHSAARVPQEPQ